jgi:hypothetical protein
MLNLNSHVKHMCFQKAEILAYFPALYCIIINDAVTNAYSVRAPFACSRTSPITTANLLQTIHF